MRPRRNVAPADEPLVTCDIDGTAKYILGPVEVERREHRRRHQRHGARPRPARRTGQWAVNIVFDDKGTEEFAEVTTRLFGLQGQAPRDQFAFVLDGQVISAPSMNGAITDGKPQITGSFTQESVEGARRPAEVRRPADQLHGAEHRHDLGDARHVAAAAAA